MRPGHADREDQRKHDEFDPDQRVGVVERHPASGHDHPDQRAAQSDASSMPIRPMGFSVAPRNERAPRNHVDVWLCYENDVDEDLLRACAPPLIEAELAKAARFYFAADRNRHIIRCALLRTVLPRYLGISHQR